VSGSGKSSLVFDVVYVEARRRFIESLALGRPRGRYTRTRPWIEGSARSQSPERPQPQQASTVATSVGLHPFLRILYSRSQPSHPALRVPVRAVSGEERLAMALDELAGTDTLDVEYRRALAGGPHTRLLAGLRGQFDAVTIDGRAWAAKKSSRVPPRPVRTHDVVVRVARLRAGIAAGRASHPAGADALGTPEVRLGARRYCVRRSVRAAARGCDTRTVGVPRRGLDTSSHRVAGSPSRAAAPIRERRPRVRRAPALESACARIQDELVRRLRPLQTLGLGHLALDRPNADAFAR